MTTEAQIKACEYVREQIQKGENVGIGICYYLNEHFRNLYLAVDLTRCLRAYAWCKNFLTFGFSPVYWFERTHEGDAQRIQLLTDYINHLKQQKQ